MPDDDNRPKVSRTTSLFPRSTYVGPTYRDDVLFIPNPAAGRASRNISSLVPPGYEMVRSTGDGVYVRPKRSSGSTENRPLGPYTYESVEQARRLEGQRQQSEQARSAYRDRLLSTITTPGDGTDVTVNTADNASLFGPLNLPNPDEKFLFDRGGPLSLDSQTGAPSRTGTLASRGVFGSADSLERQLPAGQTVTTGANENRMTIAAGVLWLRNLAARDPAAYNKLVVILRNAGYLNGKDEELPLNGYSQQVGAAFAFAANDLAQASQGGDNRTLLEYLTDRGKGYADLLAQQAADEAAANGPVDRQYTDPAALRAAAKDAARAALGRVLTDEEEARLEAAFRAKEDAFYNQIDKAKAEKGVFRGYEPNPTGQIDAFLDEPQFDNERASQLIGGYIQAFQQLIGGPPAAAL